MKDTDLAYLLNNKENNLLYLIKYGSNKIESDIDLLGIFKTNPNSNYLKIGRLDILCFEFLQLQNSISFPDPVFIEPLLFGKLIHGEQESFKKDYSERINTSLINPDSIIYLKKKLLDYYYTAHYHYERFCQIKNKYDLFESFYNLTFAMTANCYISSLKNRRMPSSYKEYLEIDSDLGETHKIMKGLNNYDDLPENLLFQNINKFRKEIKKALI